MRKQFIRVIVVLLLALVLPIAWEAIASAQYTSPNYKVDETFIGGGGELNACSTNFCSKQAAGETAVGNTSSSNFQANAGFNTTKDELLEVTVNGGDFSLGVLSPSTTSYFSTTFSIRAYLASGYIVRIQGDAPVTNGGKTFLTTLSSPTASSTGSEQFGINLRQNSTPVVGADPQQVPDNTFSFGNYSTGYDQIDHFKYVDGDEIAHSDTSSGKTIYTISFMANIATITRGGVYTGKFTILAIPTF